MADSFGVIGRNIVSNNCFNYKQKQTSRKMFNINWLSAGEYQHEIANHYRDYKNRKKVRRIRKPIFRPKKELFENQWSEYRDILPVNRIDFPPSRPDFSRRDNQVNCRLQPLDTVYDNTLRRILAANTLSELEYLTKRQKRLNKFRKGLKSTQDKSIYCSNYPHTASKTTCITNRKKPQCLGRIKSDKLEYTQFKNQLINKPTITSVDNKVNGKGVYVEKNSEGEISDVKDSYFLHLASKCYDEGFLAHIKYLESIGERNAINNQISKLKKPRHISGNTNATSRPPSAGSNVSSSNSVEDLSNCIGVRGFISVVKRLLQNRRFGDNPFNYDESIHGVIQRDWKIHVNITRSSSPESLHSSRSSIQESQDTSGPNHCIMSEILNADEPLPQEISTSNGNYVKRQQFHDLIENLNNLKISKLESLPRIVLTDFSTSNAVADRGTPKSHDNIIRKQQSLDVNIPSLSEYNSEARPP